MTEQYRSDRDNRIIDGVSHALGGVIGQVDDRDRLRKEIEDGPAEDKLKVAVDIAVAFIRFAQDLKGNAEILKKKNATSLSNNLCPDHRDKQVGKPCLACTIETKNSQYAALRDKVREYLAARTNTMTQALAGNRQSRQAAETRVEAAEAGLREMVK